jgi:hypothetical protein
MQLAGAMAVLGTWWVCAASVWLGLLLRMCPAAGDSPFGCLAGGRRWPASALMASCSPGMMASMLPGTSAGMVVGAFLIIAALVEHLLLWCIVLLHRVAVGVVLAFFCSCMRCRAIACRYLTRGGGRGGE